MTDSTQLTLIGCLRKSGELRRQAQAKLAAHRKEQSNPPKPALVEIEPAQPLVVEMEPSAFSGSTDPAAILAREPQLEAIRLHRQSHPTAAEDARRRWEAEQKRRFGCDYQDVDGVGVCRTHGSTAASRARGKAATRPAETS